MIGEITLVPQTGGPARGIIANAVAEIGALGVRYDVNAAGTCVEGDLDAILGAVRAITERLKSDGVERALIELRLQLEPHPETLEHQVEGIAGEGSLVFDERGGNTTLGLSEQELRRGLEEELLRAMHVEGDRQTVHAIAHSVARVIELDHLYIGEQLERAGVRLREPAEQS